MYPGDGRMWSNSDEGCVRPIVYLDALRYLVGFQELISENPMPHKHSLNVRHIRMVVVGDGSSADPCSIWIFREHPLALYEQISLSISNAYPSSESYR